MSTKKITIELTQAGAAELRRLADRDGLSISHLIRRALNQYCGRDIPPAVWAASSKGGACEIPLKMDDRVPEGEIWFVDEAYTTVVGRIVNIGDTER